MSFLQADSSADGLGGKWNTEEQEHTNFVVKECLIHHFSILTVPRVHFHEKASKLRAIVYYQDSYESNGE